MEEFQIKPKVYFGRDALACLAGMEAGRVLVITDPYMVESGMVNRVTGQLAGKEYRIFSQVVPDPPLDLVIQGVQEVMDFLPDLIVAMGGGSAIDEAKAIRHFAGKMEKQMPMRLVAVPTTSGTGSEVTSFAVITDPGKGIKYPLVDEELLPDAAILDASLVATVPPAIVADTGMDVLTHAMEAYVSTDATPFTDALAEGAADLVFRYLIRSFRDARDEEAREQMHYASCMAGMAFNQASLGVNHAIAHNIGGKFRLAHGRTNAILLPHVVEFNAQAEDYHQKEYTRAAQKYAALAARIGAGGVHVRAGVKNLIARIRRMQSQMEMPISLRQAGLSPESLQQKEEEIAKGALADGCLKTNPRSVTKEDVLTLLKKAT